MSRPTDEPEPLGRAGESGKPPNTTHTSTAARTAPRTAPVDTPIDTPIDTAQDVLESARPAPATVAATRMADWEHFAPLPPRPPPRPGRLRRFAGHEWTLASLVALAASLLLNWDVLRDPTGTLPQDVGDPSLVSYLIAWTGHALRTDPGGLWDFNAFFPSRYGLAFSDSMLGYAPFGLVGSGPGAAVLRYNIIFILAQALTILGGYALARQLGLGRVGASVAAAGFAFAPWRLAQFGHLHVISTGGILLALAMLARGHGIRFARTERGAGQGRSAGDSEGASQRRVRRRVRPGWALAGWLVAAWQISIGFGLGLVFAYVLLGACVVASLIWAVRRRPLPPGRLLLADLVGGLIFTAVAVLLAQPYLRVLELYPYTRRNADWVALYSPPWRGLLTAPDYSLIWGPVHETARAELGVPGEMALLPGFALLALALAGMFFSVWAVWVRAALLLGVLASGTLALGTRGPADGHLGYLLLLDHLPGFEGLRTPGRLIMWTTIFLALLAGGAVGSLVVRARAAAQRMGLPRPALVARLALLIPLALVVLEGLGTTPHVPVPPAPPSLSSVPAPYLVLPSEPRSDMLVMLWSTDRFAPTANGHSGVDPAELSRIRQQTESFPDAESVAFLREVGIRTVVVPDQLAAGSRWEDAANLPVEGLALRREVTDDAVIFHLEP